MNLQATTTKTVLDVIVQQNPDAYSDNRINSFLLKSFLEGLACCFSEELFQKFPVDYDQFMQNYANIWDLMQADHRAFWESQKFIPIPPYILDRFDQMFRDRDYGNLSHYLEGVLDVELLMRDAGECIILFLLSLLMRCVQPMTRVSLKLDNLHLSKRFDTACGYIGCCHKVEERRNTKKRGKKKGNGQQKCQKHVCVIGYVAHKIREEDDKKQWIRLDEYTANTLKQVLETEPERLEVSLHEPPPPAMALFPPKAIKIPRAQQPMMRVELGIAKMELE